MCNSLEEKLVEKYGRCFCYEPNNGYSCIVQCCGTLAHLECIETLERHAEESGTNTKCPWCRKWLESYVIPDGNEKDYPVDLTVDSITIPSHVYQEGGLYWSPVWDWATRSFIPRLTYHSEKDSREDIFILPKV